MDFIIETVKEIGIAKIINDMKIEAEKHDMLMNEIKSFQKSHYENRNGRFISDTSNIFKERSDFVIPYYEISSEIANDGLFFHYIVIDI